MEIIFEQIVNDWNKYKCNKFSIFCWFKSPLCSVHSIFPSQLSIDCQKKLAISPFPFIVDSGCTKHMPSLQDGSITHRDTLGLFIIGAIKASSPVVWSNIRSDSWFFYPLQHVFLLIFWYFIFIELSYKYLIHLLTFDTQVRCDDAF